MLASLAAVLHYLEYRFYLGRLDVGVYSSFLALLFTAVGVWLGFSLLTKKNDVDKVDLEQLESLRLNKREYEILKLIIEGYSNQAIAGQLFIALPTVKTHISNLYSKLSVKSRTQAIRKAQQHKLV